MTVDGYANCNNCSCAACDYACSAPNVNADIGFFDGFNGALVGISYGVLIAFSIIFQLVRHFCLKKKQDQQVDEDDKQGEEDEQNEGLLERPKAQ